MQKIHHLDLFSGIGGFALGLQMADKDFYQTISFCEINAYCAEVLEKNFILIGYTYNEVENGRISSLDYGIAKYPLHQWQWNEREVENYLKDKGIANPLYQHFERTGCFCCPKQSKKSLYTLYRFYPKEWEKCKELEAKAKELGCLNTTFKPNLSCVELEVQFKRNPTMDFTSAYTEDMVCFCK
ncbi:hypothetical protein LS72_009455 [Helicobacter apodemus]|uniref:Uncharacterized protein n=1 Tax=Helicobacter apodemus TaxID=135569 RepID=A0A4U8UFG2_9HELI|nr:DNA cytosine methyltransferase [Helicobacter apodemus]TLE13957.1 hypothetical protein LS72_009455 [Helicobacter apodemus]